MGVLTFFKVVNLAVEFAGIRAVDGVSFEVRPHQVCSLIGPNGAGKTTILNLISRFYQPTEGHILFQDEDITRLPPQRIARLGIARTFQNIELLQRATVLQNLLTGRHTHRRSNLLSEILFLPSVRREERRQREKVETIIDFLELQHYRDQLVAQLPYGIRKIVELGRALCMEPKLLLLDEPSSGLNAEETEDMAFWIEDIVKDLKITVIMVEHDMNLVARVSDHVLVLQEGRILAAGKPREIQNDKSVIQAYLGDD